MLMVKLAACCASSGKAKEDPGLYVGAEIPPTRPKQNATWGMAQEYDRKASTAVQLLASRAEADWEAVTTASS